MSDNNRQQAIANALQHVQNASGNNIVIHNDISQNYSLIGKPR
jgi:hypothetical protein